MDEALLSYESILYIYGFTSLCMLAGGFLLIRYTPYCLLNTSKRNIAMELHRKKLLFIPMSAAEEALNTSYKRQTILYTRGLKLLWWTIYIHLLILAVEGGFDARPIYYLTIPSILIYAGSYTEMDQPYCVNTSSIFSSDKEDILLCIQAYQKQPQAKTLTDQEQRIYNQDIAISKWYVLKLFTLLFGVLLAVILDLWFILIYAIQNFL